MTNDKKKYDVLADVSNIDDGLCEIINSRPEILPVPKERPNGAFMGAVSKINDEVFDKINDCSLITPVDISKLKKAQSFLFQTYTDVRQYRSMVQKLVTVLSSSQFPTIDSKYWQSKSEAEVHFNELQRETFKWQRARVDLNELDYKIESIEKMLDDTLTPDGYKFDPNLVRFDLDRLRVKRSQYEFEIKQLEKSIKYRIEEVTDWAALADNFEEQCKYDVRNPDSHLVETKLKMLHIQINDAESEEIKAMYKNQLDTLLLIIDKKTQQAKQALENKES